MSAWTFLKPAKKESDPPVDTAGRNQVKGEIKQLEKKQVKKDRAKVNNVLRHVDDFYDDLASARDALWDVMSHHNQFSYLFDKPRAIKRISKMMVYLRLKRQIKFHKWNTEQLKEQIPYWGELFNNDVEIKWFIDYDDYFPINVGTSNAKNAVDYVYGALKERNDFPNNHRQNTELRENMQTVIHYSIDTFNADALNTFFKSVYKHLIGKSINEVDDSVDDGHLRYVVQKLKETRHQEFIEREVLRKFRLKKVFKQYKNAVMERKAQRLVDEKIIKLTLKKFFKQYKKAVMRRKAQRRIREDQKTAELQRERNREDKGGRKRTPKTKRRQEGKQVVSLVQREKQVVPPILEIRSGYVEETVPTTNE